MARAAIGAERRFWEGGRDLDRALVWPFVLEAMMRAIQMDGNLDNKGTGDVNEVAEEQGANVRREETAKQDPKRTSRVLGT